MGMPFFAVYPVYCLLPTVYRLLTRHLPEKPVQRQRAPQDVIELIEVQAKEQPRPVSKGERVVEAHTRG